MCLGEFPRGPVVRTPCFHFRGQGFNPWSGKKDPAGCAWRGQNNDNNNNNVSKFRQLYKFIYLFAFTFCCVGSLFRCAGFSSQWLLLLQSMWALGARAQ